jgi:hypothetical protein
MPAESEVMKKILKIGSLAALGKKSMIIAYRSGSNFQINGLEFSPTDRFTFEKTEGELVIRIQLADGEFLALDEEAGLAEKFSL